VNEGGLGKNSMEIPQKAKCPLYNEYVLKKFYNKKKFHEVCG
jgi:hypothetical protein